MMLRSVTSRLVSLYCLLLVILGGAFLAFTVISFSYFAQETFSTILANRAGEIWNVSEDLLDRPNLLADVIDRRFTPEQLDRFIRIRAEGRVVYQSGEPENHSFHPSQLPLTEPSRSTDRVKNMFLYTAAFAGPNGPVIIETGRTDEFARHVQTRLVKSLLIGLPILLLAAALAGYLMMRKALTPVEVMIAAAENYSFNDPHNRLPLVGTEPRIEALGLALNRMLDRLDGAYSHVNRFSADAAHELRTPLTIIRGELELVASNARKPSEVDRAITNALEEMTRLSSIVDSLITLSCMESLWGKRAHLPVNLKELALETTDQMRVMAEEKDVLLTAPSGPAVSVAGDRERLKQVLVNLIDNAIKHTGPGGRISIQVGLQDQNGFVAVEDTGIGIDPSQHDKVFERFYRVSPDRGDHGAGLGLAIVKSICHAHGGAIHLRSVPEFGSCFTMEIPLLTTKSKKLPSRASTDFPVPVGES
jgi:signal transduction histidine kinase